MLTAVDLPNGQSVSARQYDADEAARLHATLILGHGAGAGQLSPFMTNFSRALAARGVDVITFNFPYMERKAKVPDRSEVLEACYAAVIAAVAATDRLGAQPLFIGGKSLGGRMASHLAARVDTLALPPRGVVFLGYPLHPPGKPDQLRVSHWDRIAAPLLFVQGTRDAFGSADEIAPHLSRLSVPVEIYRVERGDHSLAVPKNAGVSGAESMRAIEDAVAAWIRRLTVS